MGTHHSAEARQASSSTAANRAVAWLTMNFVTMYLAATILRRVWTVLNSDLGDLFP
jgi:hypothetical protein